MSTRFCRSVRNDSVRLPASFFHKLHTVDIYKRCTENSTYLAHLSVALLESAGQRPACTRPFGDNPRSDMSDTLCKTDMCTVGENSPHIVSVCFDLLLIGG